MKKELEIAKFEAEERRKTQEAKDDAARLAAEAEVLEKEVANDPEALPNSLLDFDYDSVDMSPPSDADNPVVPERSSGLVHNAHDSVIMVPSSHVGKSVVHQPLSKVVLDAQVDCGNVLSAKNTSDTVTSSPLFLQPKSSVASPSPQSAAKPVKSLPIYQSWIGDLPRGVQRDNTPTYQEQVIYGYSTRDCLPKLTLHKFDGDPLHWFDWSSMFKSVVHDANLSLNGKMQHLQNSVIGKAKSAIEGYGYCGDSYYEALKELESRFGKPSLVVKVTLDRLRRASRLQNDKPNEVRNLSDILSNTVWTFKRFGFESDLAAEANISLAVDKLSPELRVKWKDHDIKASNQQRPSLVEFCDWLKGQAEIYDDCYTRISNFKSLSQSFKKVRFGVSNGVTEKHVVSSNYSSHTKSAKTCPLGDGQQQLVNLPQVQSLKC